MHEVSDEARGVWSASSEAYAVIPEWVIDAEISHAAVRLYGILSMYHESSEPTVETLAARMGCAVDRIERLLVELDGAASGTDG